MNLPRHVQISLLAVMLQAVAGYSQQPTPSTPNINTTIQLLRHQGVRKELELVDYQEKQLKELFAELYGTSREKTLETLTSMMSLAREERRAKFEVLRGVMQERIGKIQQGIKATLLPHQWKRLRQLGAQSQISRYGPLALTSGGLAGVLNLSDEQKRKLPRIAQKKTLELEAEIAELRKKAHREILAEVLTKQQREELDQLLGEDFEMARPVRQPFGVGARARTRALGT